MPSNFIAKGGDGYEAIMGRWSRRLAGPFLDFSGVPSRGRVLDADGQRGVGRLGVKRRNARREQMFSAVHPKRTSLDRVGMSEKCGGLNRSTQHFIFEGQDGV